MMKREVRTPEQALVYITDCNLATVCDLAMKKSRPKHEFERQKSIAQCAVNWIVEMKINPSGTRVDDVIKMGSVEKWVEKFLPKS